MALCSSLLPRTYQIQRIIWPTRVLLISLPVCYLKILPIHKMIQLDYQMSESVSSTKWMIMIGEKNRSTQRKTSRRVILTTTNSNWTRASAVTGWWPTDRAMAWPNFTNAVMHSCEMWYSLRRKKHVS